MAVKKKAAIKKKATKKVEKVDEHGLTAKERKVADLYRGGPDDVRGNAKLCYKKVHPRCTLSTAETEGPKLLRKSQVKAYLAKMTEKVGLEADITQDRVLREVARIGLLDPRNLFHGDGSPKSIHELDDDTAAAISGLKVVQIGNSDMGVGQVIEYRLANKNDALEKLMKYLGAYEKDNSQKVDPLVAMLSRISGSALKPVDD